MSKAEASSLHVYPIAATAVQSAVYSLKTGDVSVPVQDFKDVHYAHFAFCGKAEITVSIAEEIKSACIRPLSHSIPFELSGSQLRFSITKPCKLLVETNDNEMLFIFADAIGDVGARPSGPNVVNVADFDADNTGKVLQTETIRRAVESVPKGGFLYFPPGVYLTGTIELKSDMTLHLAGGALLQGTPDPADYPLFEGMQEARHGNDGRRFSFSQFILINDAENVTITGNGTIDGNGRCVRSAGRRAHLVRVRNSRHVLIERVVLRDPASWNTHILHCEHVTVRDIKMVNDRGVGNTDGINPDSSCHVLIENNFAYCGDDCIAVKTTGNGGLLQDVEDVVARRNVLLTRKTALKLGTETRAKVMKDVTFIDNDVIECDRCMSLYCKDGATFSNIRFINNRFERCHLNNRRRMIDFSITRRDALGRIENVLIEDCRFALPWPNRSTIAGHDREHVVDGVRFVNFTVAGKVCRNAEEARIDVDDHVSNVTFCVR